MVPWKLEDRRVHGTKRIEAPTTTAPIGVTARLEPTR